MRTVASEMKTDEQQVQFLDAEDNRILSSIGRHFEAFGLQLLEPKAEAVALPIQNFGSVAGLVEKDEKHRIEYRNSYIQFD